MTDFDRIWSSVWALNLHNTNFILPLHKSKFGKTHIFVFNLDEDSLSSKSVSLIQKMISINLLVNRQ